jgi:hypothetical protein
VFYSGFTALAEQEVAMTPQANNLTTAPTMALFEAAKAKH